MHQCLNSVTASCTRGPQNLAGQDIDSINVSSTLLLKVLVVVLVEFHVYSYHTCMTLHHTLQTWDGTSWNVTTISFRV